MPNSFLSDDDRQFVERALKKNALPQQDEDFIQRALSSGLVPENIPVTSKGSAEPNWNYGKHAIDALLGGQYSKNANLEREKALWAQENPREALSATIAGQAVIPTLASEAGGAALRGGLEGVGLGAVGRFLTGAGEGSWPYRMLSSTVSGGLQGGTAGALYGNPGDSEEENVLTGAATGAGLNPLGRIVGGKFFSELSPATLRAVDALRRQGVQPRLGQLPGAGRGVQMLDRIFSGGQNARQYQDFQRALAQTAGESFAPGESPQITSDWLDRTLKNRGQDMEDIASQYDVSGQPLNQMMQRMIGTLRQARSAPADDYQRVAHVGDVILQTIQNNNGRLPGKAYQNITGYKGLLQNLQRDPNMNDWVNGNSALGVDGLRDILNDAWEQSIPSGSMQDWQDARRQYKNALAIGSLIKDKSDPSGTIDPTLLYNAVKKKYGSIPNAQRAQPAGEPNIGDLALGGNLLYKPNQVPGSESGVMAGARHTADVMGAGALMGAGLEEGVLPFLHGEPSAALPYLLGAAGLYGAGRTGNAVLSSPAALWAAATRPFVANPLVPVANTLENYQAPPRIDIPVGQAWQQGQTGQGANDGQ